MRELIGPCHSCEKTFIVKMAFFQVFIRVENYIVVNARVKKKAILHPILEGIVKRHSYIRKISIY